MNWISDYPTLISRDSSVITVTGL